MSTPACTCMVEVDMNRGAGRVILCPLHQHAEELFEALEATNNILGNQPHRDGFGIIENRLEKNSRLLVACGGKPE
jgi:hypothetical protein